MILSISEGDDKPLKYPLMFTGCYILVLNKIDAIGVFDFDIDAVKRRVQALNADIPILVLSAKTGEGMDSWADWLRIEVRDFQKRNK